MSFQEVGFIGLGLIGGSVALKLKEIYPNITIKATAGRESTIQEAYHMGLIENSHKIPLSEFSNCDYIFLCAPVQKNIEYLQELKHIIKPDCYITDVGSTKSKIHEEVTRLGLEKNFIGGHPMTGSEKTGISNADSYLFENTYYVITPTSETPESAIDEFRTFVKNLGAIPLILDYKKHDYATAAISHLPHMISFALANLVKLEDDSEETMKTIAAGGFRDMTRIAASSPIMWENICDSNTGSILSLMDLYIEQLLELRNHISNRDHQALLDYFQSAKDFRDSLTLPAKRNHSDLFEIFVDLIDEAGGIAIIASILASKGINIKNIGIINNREFEEGVLRIEFYNQESLDSASAILEKRNYKIYKR